MSCSTAIAGLVFGGLSIGGGARGATGGGRAIASRSGASRARVAMPNRIAFAARLSLLWGVAAPYVSAADPSAARSIQIEAEAQRSLGYGVFTPAALRALRTRSLARSTSADDRLSDTDDAIAGGQSHHARCRAERLRADRGHRQGAGLGHGAGHVITVD